jgi:hypothetical protein
MENRTPQEVVFLLSGPSLVHRVGLWLYPQHRLGKENDEAARLWIDAVDIRKTFLESLPIETNFTDLSYQTIIESIESLQSVDKGTKCLLIYNFDVLISYLTYAERKHIWETFLNGYPHRPKALLIVVPENAIQLLPSQRQLDIWNNEGRLANTIA